jgi:hypothetical protein
MKPITLLLVVALAWAACGFAQTPQTPAAAQVWRQTQETDTARSFNFARYTAVGKFLGPRSQVANRPALVVDCIPGTGSHADKGKFLAANLLVGTALKIVYVEPEEIHGTSYFPKVAVRYHTDGAKDQEEKWSAGTDKSSAAVPKELLKRFLRARTLAVTADDESGSPIAMQFDLSDPALVAQGCDVD